ncbi:leucine-rich alpha-2-glycoprotein [Ambystoma mexicanum]|uniref:leucine-rich alpha-2-glycoprotein n=1 Tax=Ambystoma mexicanum TaxID=8296 RepID=UPI0037E8F378
MELWRSALVTIGFLLALCFADQCPNLCSCSKEAINISVVCTSENITNFPSNLPHHSIAVTLTFTSVATIKPNAMAHLLGLEELYMSDNKLTSLPSGLFKDLPQLHTLDLSNNLLEDLPAGLFDFSVALKSLVLSGNRFTTLNPALFQQLQKLEWLDVSSNRLQRVSADCFKSLPSLKILDLSHNDLQLLADKLLSGVPNLERLNLQDTNLSSISEDVFVQTPSLAYLFLQNNSLENLPATVFYSLPFLDTLDLSYNKLSSVPPEAFSQNVKMGGNHEQGLDLSWNPWHCDCRLAYLRQWVADHSRILYSTNDTICAGPKELEGQRLIEVKIPTDHKSCNDNSSSKGP